MIAKYQDNIPGRCDLERCLSSYFTDDEYRRDNPDCQIGTS